jgi:hypothetical protein
MEEGRRGEHASWQELTGLCQVQEGQVGEGFLVTSLFAQLPALRLPKYTAWVGLRHRKQLVSANGARERFSKKVTEGGGSLQSLWWGLSDALAW